MAIEEQIRASIRRGIDLLMEELQKKLRRELEEQGHVLTKKLWNSVEYETKNIADGLESIMYTEHYGLILDRGVPAEDIPYSPGSGAGTSKYITALTKYFRLRGLGTTEARRAAFATATVHKREGMPTNASKRFSNNGRRKFWLTGTLRRNSGFIEDRIESILEEGVEIAFEAYMDDLSKVFRA